MAGKLKILPTSQEILDKLNQMPVRSRQNRVRSMYGLRELLDGLGWYNDTMTKEDVHYLEEAYQDDDIFELRVAELAAKSPIFAEQIAFNKYREIC